MISLTEAREIEQEEFFKKYPDERKKWNDRKKKEQDMKIPTDQTICHLPEKSSEGRFVNRIDVPIKMVSPTAKMPTRSHEYDAGLDLYADIRSINKLPADTPSDAQVYICIRPGERVMIPLGFAISLPNGTEAQVRPRSGLANMYGITVTNSPGTVDPSFRGEMMVSLINHGNKMVTISHHDRVAQMVVAPIIYANLIEVNTLDDTDRGSGGFGSTGK